jgi:hypothetical protein
VQRYEIFVSRKKITLGNLSEAEKVEAPNPSPPGEPQEATVSARGRVFVAIRSEDDAGNLSALTQVQVHPSH